MKYVTPCQIVCKRIRLPWQYTTFLVEEVYILYVCMYAAAAAKSLQSCPTLCSPIDGSPPGSPVPGILQARTLDWVAISFTNAWKWKVKVKSESEVAQSCPTLCNPIDGSPPGSSIHGIFQARVLEWDAIAFSDISVCVCVYFPLAIFWKFFSLLLLFCWVI